MEFGNLHSGQRFEPLAEASVRFRFKGATSGRSHPQMRMNATENTKKSFQMVIFSKIRAPQRHHPRESLIALSSCCSFCESSVCAANVVFAVCGCKGPLSRFFWPTWEPRIPCPRKTRATAPQRYHLRVGQFLGFLG